MAVNIVRPDANGIDINYGEMGVGKLDGIGFAIETFYAGLLKLLVERRNPENMPAFEQEIKLWVEPVSGNAQWIVHVLNHDDLVPLAKALAKRLGAEYTVSIHYLSRILRRYKGEELMWAAVIEDFYVDLTEDQLKTATLKES